MRSTFRSQKRLIKPLILKEGVLGVLLAPNEDVRHGMDAVFESIALRLVRLKVEPLDEVDVVAAERLPTSGAPSCSTQP